MDRLTETDLEQLKQLFDNGYKDDTAFIAAINNAFPSLLELAQDGLKLKNLQLDRFYDSLFDAFVYEDNSSNAGSMELVNAATYAKDAGIPNEWIPEVYRVFTEIYDGILDPDVEGTELEQIEAAWGRDFPTTIEEALKYAKYL